jgi:DNA replication protein DnaD
MNLINRNLLASALLLSLGAGAALAQQTAPTDAPAPPPHRGFHKPSPEREIKHLTKTLQLTPDQAAKLEPVLANRDQQLQAIRSNGQLTQQAAREQMKALHQTTEQQFASILTPTQLEEMKHMRRGPHGPRGGWQGNQSQGQPQPSGL